MWRSHHRQRPWRLGSLTRLEIDIIMNLTAPSGVKLT